MTDQYDLNKALAVKPHKNLYSLTAPKKTSSTVTTQGFKQDGVEEITPQLPLLTETPLELSSNAHLLAMNIVTDPYSTYKRRGIGLNLSMRALAKAKDELVRIGLIKEIIVAKSGYFAGTEKLYQYLKIICPYKRNVSIVHSFLTLLIQSTIQKDPQIQKTEIEAPIGTSGCTGDLIAYLKNGDRWLWENTQSSSNVTQLAARAYGQGFSRIVFVCRDDSLRKSVRKLLANANFDPEFDATIECTIFSTLIKQYNSSRKQVSL